MPRSDDFASVALDVNAGTQPMLAELTDETPFRILVAGDFSGRPGQRALKPLLIDRDNFEEVMEALDVQLRLGGGESTLRFRDLDDFHPDRIYQSLSVFQELRDMRDKLSGGGSASKAVADVRSWAGLDELEVAAPEVSGAEADLGAIAGGSLLDDILAASEPAPRASAARKAAPRDPLQAFIQKTLEPHLTAREDPRVPELRAQLDATAGGLMRAILHNRDFQVLEAAWRGLFRVIRQLETGTQLKVYLLDLTRADLTAALEAGTTEAAALQRLLVDEPAKDPDDGGWAALALHFAFSQSPEDTAHLRKLGRLVRAAGAVLLAEGDLGGGSDEPGKDGAWHELRQSPEAPFIGLALPRYLLRLPYGKQTGAVESFQFEEIEGAPAHGDLLWGNPALVCACLLGEEFSEQGWGMHPETAREFSGMPLYVYREAGEPQLRPCVELAMTQAEAEWALEAGYMPLIWIRGQDSIRLVRFQSIADPPAALAGRWG